MTVVEQMMRCVGEAASAFESRWTMRALKRVDADLYEAIDDQLSMFHEALLKGEDSEIREHGEAMCRGWVAAVSKMEQLNEPDDAVMLGQDSKTGMVVAIGNQKAATQRVRELHGERVVFLTPDEVASMFAGMQIVAKVKALWPGAEIEEVRSKYIERYSDEPAQEEV